MELSTFFKAVVDADNGQIVICGLDHTILYMNPTAIAKQHKRGGATLVGKSLLACHSPRSRELIEKTLAWFAQSPENNRVHEFYNERDNRDVYMMALRNDAGELIGYYEKHEERTRDASPFYDGL